jgi:hypothetical protein
LGEMWKVIVSYGYKMGILHVQFQRPLCIL